MKVLVIHGVFELPDDFDGTPAEGLKMFAEYAIKRGFIHPKKWDITETEQLIYALTEVNLFQNYQKLPNLPETPHDCKAFTMIKIRDSKMFAFESEVDDENKCQNSE